MKCPKCGYLGFEAVDRCRNCGYEFTLAAAALPELSLPRRTTDGPDPLTDLDFVSDKAAAPAHTVTSSDLPLFARPAAADQPLITQASPPRQPLAVRRATPEMPRLRAEPRAQSFDLAFEAESGLRSATSSIADFRSEVGAGRASAAARRDAGLWARLLAVVIDVFIVAVVDAVVIYFTVQICGISLNDVGLLPKVPLLAFLLAQNGGYLVVFTAGGQTLGKMAVGIKVVANDDTETLDLGRATRRTLVWLALAIPAGLGFVTALLSHDHRGLHDRLAGTRVVRASA